MNIKTLHPIITSLITTNLVKQRSYAYWAKQLNKTRGSCFLKKLQLLQNKIKTRKIVSFYTFKERE